MGPGLKRTPLFTLFSLAALLFGPAKAQDSLWKISDTVINEARFESMVDKARDQGPREMNEIFARTNQKEKGIGYYREYLKKEPANPTARLGLAQLLGWSGNYGEAIDTYQKLVEEQPDNVPAQMGLATTLGWDHQFARAENILISLFTADPANEDAKITYSRLLSWQARFNEAVIRLNEVLERNPHSLYGREALGFIHKWRHDYGSAAVQFEAITRLDGDSVVIREAYFQLAELAWIQGRTAEARTRLMASAKTFPEDFQFRDKLRKIDAFLRPGIQVSAYHFAEFSAIDAKSVTGGGNTGVVASLEKKFSLPWGMKAEYQYRTETADNVSPFAETRFYDVGAQQLLMQADWQQAENRAFHFFYSPTYYFNRGDSLVQLEKNTLHHGAGFYGDTPFKGKRIYYSLTLFPYITRTEEVGIENRVGLSGSVPIPLPRSVALTPSLVLHYLEDGNFFQEYAVDAERPVAIPERAGKLDLGARLTWKGYSDEKAGYFAYKGWFLMEWRLAWERAFGRFTLPVEIRPGVNMLSTAGEWNPFSGVTFILKPAFTPVPGRTLRFEATAHLNSEAYYFYFAGLTYEM